MQISSAAPIPSACHSLGYRKHDTACLAARRLKGTRLH